MANIPYPEQYDDSFINIFKRIIDELNAMGYTYDEAMAKAKNILDEARQTNDMNKDVQRQLNNIILENGNSDAEVVQARGGSPLLKDRLDKADSQLAETASKAADITSSIHQGYYEKALVSFVFDDGQSSDITKFKPIFESEGVPGCANLITSTVGDPGVMTWEQAKELKKLGWTVSSHTHTHISVLAEGTTDSQIDYEYGESSRLLKEHGLDHDIIVYPYGHVDARSLKIAKKYYKMGVNIVRDYLSNTIPKIDNMNLKRVAGLSQGANGTEPTLEECKAVVDKAIIDNEYIIFEDHSSYAIWDSLKLDELQQLIQYIKSKGIPIVNLQDGFNMKCNVIQTGESDRAFKVFRSGLVQTQGFEDYSYDNNTPITYFPYGETKTWFSNAQAEGKGFPTGGGGLVTTVRVSNSIYFNDENLSAHQTFRGYNRTEVYMRVWKLGNEWGEWGLVSSNETGQLLTESKHLVNPTLNAYSASNLLSDFPNNQITTFHVNGAGGAGMPTNSAGVVTTYRIGSQMGYSRQEFRKYRSNEVWSRWVNDDGTWGVWEKVSSI